MTKYEIARWVTPGLAVVRLVFTTYGGSAHGEMKVEYQPDPEEDIWEEQESLGTANGIPSTVGEEIASEHINQFTGKTVN